MLNIPGNFDVIAYITIGFSKAGMGSPDNEIIYHYGSEENFRNHKRRYSIEQVVCHNCFQVVEGDVTGFSLKNNEKESFIKKIIRKLVHVRK